MKLYNTIAIYDVYTVAESNETAREALLAAIAEGLKPSESTATETVREGAIRQGFREERPFVAADVSEVDFNRCKGKTTAQMFELLYLKRGSK
jgi:hypothetical protein